MNIPDKIFLSQTDVKLASQHGSASTYIPYVSEMVHNRLMAEKDAEIERLQGIEAIVSKCIWSAKDALFPDGDHGVVVNVTDSTKERLISLLLAGEKPPVKRVSIGGA